MNDSRYYHHPAIGGDTTYFVSEDYLWSVASAFGVARRITSGLGAVLSCAVAQRTLAHVQLKRTCSAPYV
jgi:tricorn protease-like protein